jgi:hypothetical protein
MTVRITPTMTSATLASWSTAHGPMTRMGVTGYLRFRPCPQCGGRKRALLDVGDSLRGHCLRCGEDLGDPLATTPVPWITL